MDHLETTEKNLFHVNYNNPITESTMSKPDHGDTRKHNSTLANTVLTQNTQRPKHFIDISRETTDEDESFDIDVRSGPFDEM